MALVAEISSEQVVEQLIPMLGCYLTVVPSVDSAAAKTWKIFK
jgi:hypothetical protein